MKLNKWEYFKNKDGRYSIHSPTERIGIATVYEENHAKAICALHEYEALAICVYNSNLPEKLIKLAEKLTLHKI